MRSQSLLQVERSSRRENVWLTLVPDPIGARTSRPPGVRISELKPLNWKDGTDSAPNALAACPLFSGRTPSRWMLCCSEGFNRIISGQIQSRHLRQSAKSKSWYYRL